MRFIYFIIGFLILNSCKDNSKNPELNFQESIAKNDSSYISQLEKHETRLDTFRIETGQKLIVYPSSREIDSLKNLWSEDKFYIIADDENANLSKIYNLLEKQDISYKVSDASTFYLVSSNLILKKKSLPYAWGVLEVLEDGSSLFKNTTDFLVKNDKKTYSNKIDFNELKNTTWQINCDYNDRLAISAAGAQLIFADNFSVNTTIENIDDSKYNLLFKSPPIRPIPDLLANYTNFSSTKPIATIEIKNGNLLNFEWLGFYDNEKKEYVVTENPFKTKSALLIRCF